MPLPLQILPAVAYHCHCSGAVVIITIKDIVAAVIAIFVMSVITAVEIWLSSRHHCCGGCV